MTKKVYPERRRKGFTLIELLVVISIIGILSTVVITNLNSGRIKARDTKRKSDLKQLQTAIDLYYNDQNVYPSSTSATPTDTATNDTFKTNLSPFLQVMPADPIASNTAKHDEGYFYAYGSDSSDQAYALRIRIEETAAFCLSGINTTAVPAFSSSGVASCTN